MDPAELVRPLAQVWLTQRKYHRVLEELQVGDSASQADRAAALVARGSALRGLGRPAEAERSFQTALTHDPNRVAAYLGIARIAMAESNYAKADRTLSDALATAPKDFDILALKGDLHFKRANYEAAESTYLELLSIRPDSLAIRLAVAQAQIAGGRSPVTFAKDIGSITKRCRLSLRVSQLPTFWKWISNRLSIILKMFPKFAIS